MTKTEKQAYTIIKAIRFARPVIADVIRSYRRSNKILAQIRRQIEPKRLRLINAQSRQDEIEADYDLIEAIKVANRRATDGERKSTNLDKYNNVYVIGKADSFDLADANDPLTGKILTTEKN